VRLWSRHQARYGKVRRVSSQVEHGLCAMRGRGSGGMNYAGKRDSPGRANRPLTDEGWQLPGRRGAMGAHRLRRARATGCYATGCYATGCYATGCYATGCGG
jgi:hypothetical protein